MDDDRVRQLLATERERIESGLSALDRTESRESFYREDYPETNDDEWFVWHGITKDAGGSAAFDREPIPLERFPLRRVLLALSLSRL